ncbi:MAG: hypothetical protein JXR04_11355 [Bermanella sp.]
MLGEIMYRNIAVLIASLFISGVSMAEGLFIHSHSDVSGRFAILDEDEQVAFLYLSKPYTQEPEKDAIAYMRVSPPKDVDWAQMAKSGMPPVLSEKFASSTATIRSAKESQFSFQWSIDGNSAALLYNGKPIAFVSSSEPIGYSKAVAKENKLTNPWSESLYDKLFSK